MGEVVSGGGRIALWLVLVFVLREGWGCFRLGFLGDGCLLCFIFSFIRGREMVLKVFGLEERLVVYRSVSVFSDSSAFSVCGG